MGPFRVAIAGTMRVHIEGLEIALTAESDFQVVSAGEAGQEGDAADLVVVDAGVADVYCRLAALTEQFEAGTPLVAVGVSPAHLPYYRRAGFAACLGPEDSVAQLVATVRSTLTEPQESSWREPGGEQRSVALTSRELEILTLISDGLSNGDIARRLHIAVATVKNHVHSVLAKLGVHRRGEAARWLRGDAALPLPVSCDRVHPQGVAAGGLTR